MEDKDNSIKKTRKRRQNHLPLADYIYKQSPIKGGLVIKDEDKPLAKYDKITKKIFLGNYQIAKDKDFFKKNKIKAVLNCTKELPNHFANNKDIEYMRIPVDDSLKEKDFDLMFKYMPVIAEFINKHVNVQNNNILIHCFAGRQRSCCAVATFLMDKYGLNPHESCEVILKKRPEAFHYGQSLNFDQAIEKYYKNVLKKKRQ
jgi:protein-tyrosine phosphatase